MLDNKTVCTVCQTDLSKCEEIYAAEGMLFCSRTCGIRHFSAEYGKDASTHFDDVSEVVIPEDIGL